MKKSFIVALIALSLVGGFIIFGQPKKFSSDGGQTQYSSPTSKEFSQVGITASASQQGNIKQGAGRVFSIEVTSDASGARFLQIFNEATAVVPARAASVSGCGQIQCLKIYQASTSWASATSLAAKPLGSYQQYASRSLIYSLPIPGATASSSPTVVRVNSADFAPALGFTNGLMFGISTNYATYASPAWNASSITNARVKVKIHWE